MRAASAASLLALSAALAGEGGSGSGGTDALSAALARPSSDWPLCTLDLSNNQMGFRAKVELSLDLS